jgi:Zn-dependent peptidase ImmA (M78 family)
VAIIEEMGVEDPREAVRQKARILLGNLLPLFPNEAPFNMQEIASCIGLHASDEEPRFSADSEIAPDSAGNVILRINKSRPITRQRFSIAHEIGHTLFPDYQLAVRCRKAHDKRWNDDDFLETLCDVAASEFMFPMPWFENSIATLQMTGEGIASLADKYQASREATVRRLVELHPEPMAAVYFSWKLKPEEHKQLRRNANQQFLFESLRPDEPTKKLRVDYPILNESFRSQVLDHIPVHKSIPNEGPIYQSATTLLPCDGTAVVSFGRIENKYRIIALPIYTDDADFGPKNARSVVALLRPV